VICGWTPEADGEDPVTKGPVSLVEID